MRGPRAESTASLSPGDDLVRVRIPIAGMSCASCVRRVEGALAEVDGVGSAVVDLALGLAHLRYDPTRVTVGRISEVVAEAGFSPGAPDIVPEEDATPSLLPRAVVALLAGGLMMGFVDATLPPVLLIGLLAVATPIQLWAGAPFYAGAWRAARRRTVDMNTLVALATTVAWASSAFVSLFPATALAAGFRTQIYYEPALMILGLVLIGRVLEQRARGRTWAALRALVGLQPESARVIRNGEEIDVSIAAVRVGDRVRVRPGERVAVDGVIEDGSSAVDESMVTGESIPVEKHPGAEVIAGTQNGSGSLVVRAARVGHDATVARIVALVVQAQASKAPIQRLADRVAAVFVPTILALALLTFGSWAFFGAEPGLSLALRRAIAVLVVACPCALGLATPTAILVGVTASAARGILVRSGRAFEVAHRIDTVVFDKTGTLTAGAPVVSEVVGDEREVLALAAAVEVASEHPLAEAVVGRARALGLRLSPAQGFRAWPGRGVGATVDGRHVLLGSARFLEEAGVRIGDVGERAAALAADGTTVLYVAADGAVIGVVAVMDPPNLEAAGAIARLRAMGLEVQMASGDAAETAHGIARRVGIGAEHVAAGLLPEDKEELVRALQASGRVVAMVGDGINDAPALARADLGIALGTGTDAAIGAAEITLVRSGLDGVAEAIRLSRRGMTVIRQNLFWAFAYNAVLVPLAMGAFHPLLEIDLSPVLSSFAMSLSSVSVVTNSLRLRHESWSDFLSSALQSLARLEPGYALSDDAR